MYCVFGVKIMVGPESGARPSQEGTQGEVGIDVPRIEKKRNLTQEERERIPTEVFREYVKQALPVLYTMVRNGEGKDKLDVVGGRPGEKRMVIDLTAYHLFKNAVEKSNAPYVIFSEEDQRDTSLTKGEEDTQDFIFYIVDPIENSSPYAKGVKGAGVFSIGSATDPDGIPLAGFAIDIEEAQAVMSIGGKNYLYTYEMIEKPNGNPRHKNYVIKDPEGKPASIEEVFPSRIKTLNDPDASFYTFMGEKEWAELAMKLFLPKLLEKFDQKTHAELSRGGSHMYPNYLSVGRGVGYGIVLEPVSEVYTALAAATFAGLIMRNVHKDGTHKEIKVNPRELIKNPDLYREGKIEFLVSATTPEVADEIEKAYLDQLAANELIEAKLAVADTHPEEVEIFLATKRASQQTQNSPTG